MKAPLIQKEFELVKVNVLILSVLLLCMGQITYAEILTPSTKEKVEQPETPEKNKADSAKKSGFFSNLAAEMLYGYTDFNFHSSEISNFNQFKGHSNLYAGGAEHLTVSPSITGGIYFFRINTEVDSKFSLSPFPVSDSKQTIKNNTIFAHVLKIVKPQFFIDVAAGYGYNHVNTFTTLQPSALNTEALLAYAINNTNNWFFSVNGIYRKPWKKFLFRGNLGVFYSKINAPEYNFIFPTINFSDLAQNLTNRATLILESVEVGYNVNPKFMPFIGAGLIQVAQFSFNRPVINPTTVINGSLPQLFLNKDAFRLVAGFSYKYKKFALRVEEKYYNASSTFKSYQTLVILEYKFS
jgi:hypothetical protein